MLSPRAFLGSLPISAVLMLFAVIMNISIGRIAGITSWFTAATALVSSTLSMSLVILEFVLGFEMLDPFFEKKQIDLVSKLVQTVYMV